MTHLLNQAFNRAAKLPASEQIIFAKWVMDELKSKKRWSKLFSGSQSALSKLASEALEEHKRRKTRILKPDDL